MSVFKKLFGSKKKEEEIDPSHDNLDRKYLPDLKQHIDEKFTLQFAENGGKFLYCLDFDEVGTYLTEIIHENNWSNKKAYVLKEEFKEKFKKFDINFSTDINETDFFFTTCEFLVASNGSILISSNQIAEKKLSEFPANFVVFATTSQLVENISEGLHGIKARNKSKIPSNITTIKHFKISEEKNFLSYGSSAKNLYLLLLEDL